MSHFKLPDIDSADFHDMKPEFHESMFLWEMIAVYLLDNWVSLLVGTSILALIGLFVFTWLAHKTYAEPPESPLLSRHGIPDEPQWVSLQDYRDKAALLKTKEEEKSENNVVKSRSSEYKQTAEEGAKRRLEAKQQQQIEDQINFIKAQMQHSKSGTLANSMKSMDPVHQFSDGERENLPFQCPFMDAFKKAQAAAEKERKEKKTGVLAKNTSEASGKENDPQKISDQSNKDASPETKSRLSVTDTEELIRKSKETRDPAEVSAFYQHIPAHVKQLEQKKMLQELDETDLQKERQIRAQQLAEIYKLMASQPDAFGVSDIDEMHDQMRLYVR